MREDLLHLLRHTNTTALLVTHDHDEAFAMADRITVMNAGRILAEGTPEQIRANADVQHAYLGTPEETGADG